MRASKEELGVDIEVIKQLGSHSFQQREQAYDYTWFLARIVHGRPRVLESDHDDVGMFSISVLRERDDVSPNLKNLVRQIFDDQIDLSV